MHVLAYLARRQGADVLTLIKAEAEQDLREHGTELNVMSSIVECYYSDVLATVLREHLAGDDPKAATWAAYYLSTNGARDDIALLEARLNRTPSADTRLLQELTDAVKRIKSRFPGQ
jgi:hypothetical protein